MFEQNAAHFGSTVESLLYRYGKVKLFDLLFIALFRNFLKLFSFLINEMIQIFQIIIIYLFFQIFLRIYFYWMIDNVLPKQISFFKHKNRYL